MAALLVAPLALSCGERAAPQLPRYGEVVVSIDTDAPVPDFVGRLRVDLFDQHGRWLQSRDAAQNVPGDWPASFSVFTADEHMSSQVLVRVRGYLEGRVRDYHGEQFRERKPYVEPWVAQTLQELCANQPELVLGQELTLRRGTRTLTGLVPSEIPQGAPSGFVPQCWSASAGGVVAARLSVRQAGEYRIETVRVDPPAADPTLFIRTDCRDARSQFVCNDDISRDEFTFDLRSRLVVHLEPGSYTVMSGGPLLNASDVTLRADLAANWEASKPQQPQPVALGSRPRLVLDGLDETPRDEPEPHVTIDRLALITLVPGRKQRASIVLRTACAGQMAKLSAAASDAAPVLSEAETCVDTEGKRVALTDEPLLEDDDAPSESLVGTLAASAPCASMVPQQGSVCIPGGTFVFGSPQYIPYPVSTTPERFALMNRFWLDTDEVTVGRWRSALARGFKSPNFTPVNNEGPLAPEFQDSYVEHCTFSNSPNPGGESRESYPLNCLDWGAARAFCRFEGGDLPTEAQWQYAASKAGRATEVDDFCARGAGGAAPSEGACQTKRDNPVSVSDPVLDPSTTPLGVRGLISNVSEMVLDSFYALDSPCWDGATLIDPVCWERNAPFRTVAGGDWGTSANVWRRDFTAVGNAQTDFFQINIGDVVVGFRCAYAEEPR